MKKLLLILLAFSTVSFAGVEGYESIPYNGEGAAPYGTVCIGGYLFAFMQVWSHKGHSISIQQIFKDGSSERNPNDPIKCEVK